MIWNTLLVLSVRSSPCYRVERHITYERSDMQRIYIQLQPCNNVQWCNEKVEWESGDEPSNEQTNGRNIGGGTSRSQHVISRSLSQTSFVIIPRNNSLCERTRPRRLRRLRVSHSAYIYVTSILRLLRFFAGIGRNLCSCAQITIARIFADTSRVK